MWDEKFEKELLMPELAMIRFVVVDEDVGSRDDFIGQFSLPFTSVRPGMLLYLSLLYCLKYRRSLTVIPRARMGSESIAHSAFGLMGY